VSVDSRIQKAPLRILCQHAEGSCGACCGAYNFKDRSAAASHARWQRRTDLVTRAWPDTAALAEVRDLLLDEERAQVLFSAVKVCPFAGYVEDERLGCLLHPTRHPTGADLRDLAVYPREICAGHFCASHDWLRQREADLAQTARGTHYGRVVTDAALVKSLAQLLDDALGRPFRSEELAHAREQLDALWQLVERWPFRDADPTRFGGSTFAGPDATEHLLPSCLAGLSFAASPALRRALDALGTRPLAEPEAPIVAAQLSDALAAVARAIGS
jgi:hypothetical protein